MPPGEWFATNMQRAGELFIYSLWLQGQMADLLILQRNPNLVEPFLATPDTIPEEFLDLRTVYWQSDFAPTKAEFVETFAAQLTDQDREDLEYIGALRNAIAHAHVSIARDYFLYRPRSHKEAAVIAALQLPEREGAREPRIVKLAFFDDESYIATFARITRLDEKCFARVAGSLGIRQGRIR